MSRSRHRTCGRPVAQLTQGDPAVPSRHNFARLSLNREGRVLRCQQRINGTGTAPIVIARQAQAYGTFGMCRTVRHANHRVNALLNDVNRVLEAGVRIAIVSARFYVWARLAARAAYCFRYDVRGTHSRLLGHPARSDVPHLALSVLKEVTGVISERVGRSG